MKVIGLDNGSTGTFAIYEDGKLTHFGETPSIVFRKPTKKESYLSRINWSELERAIGQPGPEGMIAVIERPMSDPVRFAATVSSQRAMESLLCLTERLQIPVMTIDSSAWQKIYFPGVRGSELLKRVSMELGCELFPQYKELIIRHKDADGLFIATAVATNKIEFIADVDRVFPKKKVIRKRNFKSNV